MPRLRDTDDLDVDALDAVEYSTEKYTDYAGEVPPIGLELTGYVKRLWWTRTQKDDPMLKVLWEASDNEGDNEEYNGCPFWLNAALIPGAKFRWDPFLLAYGLTLTEVKTKTYVAKEEDQNGFVIERIGTWKPGADRDEAWCRIITGQEPYNGTMQAIADEWIGWDEESPAVDDEADEEGDEEGDEPDEDEEGDEPDEDEPDEDEADEEPEPPARGRGARSTRTATKAAQPARGSRTASKPATAKTGRSARTPAASAAPARSARSTRAPKEAAAAPARSTRTRRTAKGGDAPF